MEGDGTRQFDFKLCPYCGGKYEDQHVLKVKSDQLGPNQLILRCGKCAVTYSAERTIIWKARLIERGKLPGLEAAEFLKDRAERMEKHFEAMREAK